jgi:flagellar basal-body rod modification protein FlgD
MSTAVNGASSLGDSASQVFGTGSSTLGKEEFLKILVTQLKNQDPMSPLDDKDFIGQMAQLSSLEATTNMGSQVQDLVNSQQQMQAMLLVGRTVQYADENGDPAVGAVAGVRLDSVPPSLVIGEKDVPITRLQTVL